MLYNIYSRQPEFDTFQLHSGQTPDWRSYYKRTSNTPSIPPLALPSTMVVVVDIAVSPLFFSSTSDADYKDAWIAFRKKEGKHLGNAVFRKVVFK